MKLLDCQKIYVCPSIVSPSTCVSVSDNQVRVINTNDQTVFKTFKTTFDLTPYGQSPDYLGGETSIFSANIYHPVVCGGRFFLQYYDWVCELRGGSVSKIC